MDIILPVVLCTSDPILHQILGVNHQGIDRVPTCQHYVIESHDHQCQPIHAPYHIQNRMINHSDGSDYEHTMHG